MNRRRPLEEPIPKVGDVLTNVRFENRLTHPAEAGERIHARLAQRVGKEVLERNSAYYFGRRAVALQVMLIAAAYGVTLWLIDPGPIAPSRWLTTTGLAIGTAIVVRLLSERVERLIAELAAAARVDRLTGLANRRAFEEQFARDSARARRTGRPLTLLLADVDDFKAINDRWGHAAGDAALVAVAKVLSECTRSGDTPARIGGDEFAVLLTDTHRAAAQVIVARLAEALTTHGDDSALGLTLSVGLAVQEPEEEAALGELMRIADMALYAAKRSRAARLRSAWPASRPLDRDVDALVMPDDVGALRTRSASSRPTASAG